MPASMRARAPPLASPDQPLDPLGARARRCPPPHVGVDVVGVDVEVPMDFAYRSLTARYTHGWCRRCQKYWPVESGWAAHVKREHVPSRRPSLPSDERQRESDPFREE